MINMHIAKKILSVEKKKRFLGIKRVGHKLCNMFIILPKKYLICLLLIFFLELVLILFFFLQHFS